MVLLPVFGIPATIKRKVRFKPFACALSLFSSVIAFSFWIRIRFVEIFVESHFTAYLPCRSKSFKKPSTLLASARSALLSTYKIGFSPKIFFKFLFTVAMGARASKTQITPSQRSLYFSMSRMAFVMCPGNHCMFFIVKIPYYCLPSC